MRGPEEGCSCALVAGLLTVRTPFLTTAPQGANGSFPFIPQTKPKRTFPVATLCTTLTLTTFYANYIVILTQPLVGFLENHGKSGPPRFGKERGSQQSVNMLPTS